MFLGGLTGCGRTPRSGADDLAHGIMETQAQHLDEEVDGVAVEVALRPAPVAFFDDETGERGQLEVTRFLLDELDAAFLEQRGQGSDSGGADLFARLAQSFR